MLFNLHAISTSKNETPLENVFYVIQYPNILRAMTSSVVTGIIGIQTTGINGIRDILAKNYRDKGYSDPA